KHLPSPTPPHTRRSPPQPTPGESKKTPPGGPAPQTPAPTPRQRGGGSPASSPNQRTAGPRGPSTATFTSHQPGSGSWKTAAWKSLLVAAAALAGYSRTSPVPRAVKRTVTRASGKHSPVAVSKTSTLTSTSPARNGVGEVNTVT